MKSRIWFKRSAKVWIASESIAAEPVTTNPTLFATKMKLFPPMAARTEDFELSAMDEMLPGVDSLCRRDAVP